MPAGSKDPAGFFLVGTEPHVCVAQLRIGALSAEVETGSLRKEGATRQKAGAQL